MKFAMIYLEIRSKLPCFTGYYAEGVGSIASVVKNMGHTFELIHLTRAITSQDLIQRIKKKAPDLIGFSCMTNMFQYLKIYAPVIKDSFPNVPIIVGGVHATLNPQECMNIKGVDAVCIGEGENAIKELLSNFKDKTIKENISSLWVSKNNKIWRNPVAPLITDLDSFPTPDPMVFDFSDLLSSKEGVLYISASRGCPYTCNFCCNQAIRSVYPNSTKYFRFKSVPRVLTEINNAIHCLNKKPCGIYFQDDILPLNKEWFKDLVREYPKHFDIPFNCNLRADLITPELVIQLKSMGCNSVTIGLESGDESIRNDLLGKKINNEIFYNGCELLVNTGILVNTFSMVGLPGESLSQALKTVEMNAELKLNKSMVSIFLPYSGTKLFEFCRNNGYLTDTLPDTYQQYSPLQKQKMTASQVKFIHVFFWYMILLFRKSKNKTKLRKRLIILLEHDGVISFLNDFNNVIKRLLSTFYIKFGIFFVNRQSKIFK